jgi:hypothetical protein
MQFLGLLERLKVRREFYLVVNEAEAEAYIWNQAKRLKTVDIYLIKEPRGDLILQDRRDFVDQRGNMYEPVRFPFSRLQF